MSPSVDDGSEMNSPDSSVALSEADADALLSGRPVAEHGDLREIIGLMRAASAVPSPTPTEALAAVLDNGFDPVPVASAPSASRWGRWTVRLAAATATAMAVTLGAATANALPGPVQTAVANIVGAVTPLQLPRPPAHAKTGRGDNGGASDESAAVPSEQPNADQGADEPSAGSPKSSTRVTAPPRPAVVTPSPPRATATPTHEPDESDEPDTDEPDADEPVTDEAEPHADEPEQPGTESAETDEADAGDRDLLDSGETELNGDAEPEQDEAGADT